MSNVNDLNMTAGINGNELKAAAARLLDLQARPELQHAREELLATPQGAALLEKSKQIYRSAGEAAKSACEGAADQLSALAEANGVPSDVARGIGAILNEAPVVGPAVTSERVNNWLNTAKSAAGGEGWGDIQRATDTIATRNWSLDSAQQQVASQGAAQPQLTSRSVGSTAPASAQPGGDSGASMVSASAQPASSQAQPSSSGSTLNQYLTQTESSPPLSSSNATDVDYNILTELSYTRKYCNSEEYRLASEKDGLTIGEYCKELELASVKTPKGVTDRDAYIESLRNDPEALAKADTYLDSQEREFLQQMQSNSRYSNLTIDHADGLDTGTVNTQVIVVRTEDNHAMIAVEGTNGTTTDWANNAKFASSEPTEEELYLGNLINGYVEEYDSFDIAGHSQGGRDAVTSVLLMDKENRDKARRIISQDGPGYTPEFLQNYQEQIAEIEDKVTNIRPTGSFVGQIFIPIGDVKYVITNTTGFNSHDHRTWVYATDENGNVTGYYIEGEPDDTTQLITDFTLYAADRFPPGVIEETLPIVLRLLADPDDPEDLDFKIGNLVKNLDSVSFGDGLMLASMGGVLITDGLIEVIDTISPYLDTANTILTILSVVPWPGAPICGEIAAILGKVQDILDMVKKVCEVLGKICEKYLEYKAQKMKAEREAYIAGNARMVMNYDAMRRAQAALDNAAYYLDQARISGDSMWDHFAQRSINERTSLIENILKLVWEVVTNNLDPLTTMNWVRKNVADAAVDTVIALQRPYCVKGSNAISLIMVAGDSLPTSVGLPGVTNNDFTVTPASLGEQARNAERIATTMREQITDAHDTINRTGSIWQADDYDSIKTVTDKAVDQILDVMDTIKDHYKLVGMLAENYNVFQSTAVQEFQAAAN